MKKLVLTSLSFIILSSMVTSCKSRGHCAAYSKINKVKTEKDIAHSTQRAI